MRTIANRPVRPARRRLVWLTAAVTAIALALACGGGGSEEDDGDSGATGEEPKKPKAAGIGEPARDGKFEFTVQKVERGKTQVGDQYAGKKAQGEFVLVYVTVKNIADEPQSFFGDDQKVISTNGKQYGADSEAAIYIEESQSLYEEINPGNQVKGIVVFDVPKETKLAKVELHDSAFSGGVQVSL